MAGERRTRAEKSRAQIHRQEGLSYSFHAQQGIQIGASSVDEVSGKSPKAATKRPKPVIRELFAYDVHLIYKDLIKTVVIAGVILLALVGVRVGLQ